MPLSVSHLRRVTVILPLFTFPHTRTGICRKACTDLSRCSSKQKQTAVNKINSILFWIHNLGCLYLVFDLTPDGKGKRPSTNLSIIDTSHRTRKFMAKKNVFLLSHNLVPVVHAGRTGLPASGPAWSAGKQRIQMDNCYSVLYLTGPLSVSGETNWFDNTGGRSNWLGYVSQRWVGGGAVVPSGCQQTVG